MYPINSLIYSKNFGKVNENEQGNFVELVILILCGARTMRARVVDARGRRNEYEYIIVVTNERSVSAGARSARPRACSPRTSSSSPSTTASGPSASSVSEQPTHRATPASKIKSLPYTGSTKTSPISEETPSMSVCTALSLVQHRYN